MQLHENIRDYYYAHFKELSTEKQFHFASRLAAWHDDPVAHQHLADLRSTFVPATPDEESLQAMLVELLARQPQPGKANASELRDQYFAKYPGLHGISLALFRVRHLLKIYNIDARPALRRCISNEALLALQSRLLADPDGMRTLSTYAINSIYLINRIALERDEGIDIDTLYELGKGYDLSDPIQIQLFIYFYTHCIIDETNFYVRKIPDNVTHVYTKMLIELEAVIAAQYDHINLDNKLEFLVCCRIMGYPSLLFARIYAECEQSISDAGYFLVDRHNDNRQSNKTSLSTSEHRNVLCIMSGSEYTPHATPLADAKKLL